MPDWIRALAASHPFGVDDRRGTANLIDAAARARAAACIRAGDYVSLARPLLGGDYMCRGNFRSSWVAQGGYDFVADALFNELTVDGYFMEFDDERSGGFAPLRFVPKGKYVVLGLVTSKRGELEAKDDLKRRIEEASKFVDIDQLCLSPQCGFSSTLEGNSLSRDQQIAKLRLVVETAEEVWGTQ